MLNKIKMNSKVILGKLSIAVCILIILSAQFLSAELPFAISDETVSGYDIDAECSCLANELIIEKEFDVLKGLTVGVENVYAMDDLTGSGYADEITLGLGLGISDFLSVGLAPKLFIFPEGSETGLDTVLALGHEFEKIGLIVEDENEFLYNFTVKAWEYVNTLGIEKSLFQLGKSVYINLFLENEYVRAIEKGAEAEDGLKAGPAMNISFFSLGVFYSAALAPEVAHGIEGSIVFSF